jgi:hypothetical protein
MTALNMPLLSGVRVSTVVPFITGVSLLDELYILNVNCVSVITGFPLGSVSLPSYPIICGIAANEAGEAATNIMNTRAKYFLNIELHF